MKQDLEIKIAQAVALIRTAGKGKEIEVAYSGGKDSEVILHLVRQAGVSYRAIHKCTTIDPPYTLKHCIENGVEIRRPKKNFLQLVQSSGMPTIRSRHCCRVLKEYKILNDCVLGVRRLESVSRKNNYSPEDPIVCRMYGKNKQNHVNQILPILNWTEKDIEEYVEKYHLKCHPLYYDKKGKFHPERRLGCIGCCMQSDRGKAEYKKYPKLFKQIVSSVVFWWNTHPNAKSHSKFGDPYALIVHNLFFHSYEEWQAVDTSFFGRPDYKTFLENYFCIELK